MSKFVSLPQIVTLLAVMALGVVSCSPTPYPTYTPYPINYKPTFKEASDKFDLALESA
jgi:hypothetical protein